LCEAIPVVVRGFSIQQSEPLGLQLQPLTGLNLMYIKNKVRTFNPQ
jgi:hypothetical protein